MKRSYILLSLIVSQALCADTVDLVANFGSTASSGGNPSSVTKPNGQETDPANTNATYNTDWTGSTSYLNVKTNNLTFAFLASSETNLVINNGFSFANKTSQTDTQANIIITKANNSGGAGAGVIGGVGVGSLDQSSNTLTTLVFGSSSSTGTSSYVTLGSNINLKIMGFTDVKIANILSVASSSTLDVSEVTNVVNDGGIVLEGKDSTLKVKDTLTNNGTILMRDGSKIESVSNLSIQTTPPQTTPPTQGTITVQGGATISSGSTALTIKNQDIKLQNLASKNSSDSSITDFSQATLTLSTTGTGTLTLGTDSSNGVVNIFGELSKTDTSITNLEGTSEVGNLILSGFTSIEAKNVNFKNVNVTSSSLNAMTITSGTLGLENTTIAIGDNSSTPAQNLDFGMNGTSTITLTGQNTISTTGTLTVTGTHNFTGSGSLDFVGNTVNLGNGSSATLGVSGSSGSPTIGVSASTINTNSLTLTGLTLQTIGSSSIVNTKMTLSDSTIEAIDSEGNLADLSITKNSSAGTIEVSSNTSVTLRGEGILITEQNITLENGSASTTTLTLQAEKNGVTLDGGTSGMTISAKNTSLQNNLLSLNTPLLTLKGKVTFENVVMMSNRDLTIIGTASKDSSQGMFISKNTSSNASTIFVGTKGSEGVRFHALTFTSQGMEADKQAYLKIDAGNSNAVDFRASSFTFQNQEIDLATNTSGTELRLFAYGNGLINDKFLEMKNSFPTAQLSGSGVFNFSNTTFSDGSGSKVELYAGSGGVAVLPSNLTLSNVSIDAKIIDDNGGNSLNTLDLSSTEGSINILGTSTISASKFVYGDSITDSSKTTQGIGVDLFVGNETTKGNLTLNGSGGGDNFIIGGEIALDLRGTNGSATSIDIEIQNGTSNKLSNNTLGLTFQGGGLTVIGSGSSSTHTFKAKSFTFEEIKDGDVVVDSPFVKVQNAQLTLNGEGSMQNIDLVGTTYLLGDTTGSNETKLIATNNGQPSGQQVTLKLHDIQASGKASIADNKLEFSDSNITVSDSDSSQGLLLKDVNTSGTDPLTGTIASITLNNGKLQFQNNGSTNASITLNADSAITSSGTSTLTLKTIKVGDGSDTNLYSLNITDGTFTLQEESAGTQLGGITLGTTSSQGGSGGNFVYKNGSASSYQSLTLKGDLTSYGNSSISAQSFTISAKDSSTNYAISSTGGELKLIAQDSSALTATADITLNNGSLGYYGSSNTLASLSLSSSSSISSVGDSVLQANSLNVNGASMSASGGTLTLKGISSSTTAGDVYVGNAGVLTLQNSNTSLATLKISDGSALSLSADVAYITPSSPLGGGVFGQVNVQSLLFESKSGSLINIALNSSSTSSYSDSLFALREGAITLISTQDGIKKKQNNASYTDITLSDISTDTSGLTSITLTPYLQAGKDKSGKDIVQNLLLDLRVSQTNITQLIESIQDSSAKESMTSIVNSGNNALILESIMQSGDNAFKVGMAEYISAGNVAVVQTALDYINGAMSSLSDSMFASNKIYELIAMLKTANVENRMVRAKNPFMAKTQLASLVKSYIGTAYASSDDSLLLEEESSTPNYGELWATFDGAMSFSQEESGNSSLYGFSAGYDTIVGERKNYLLGFYASYGYGAYSVNYARNNSHNFGLGFYTRMSFENSEVDLILSQNVGLNHTDVDLGASNSYVAQALKQTLSYNFYTTDIEARYGYVFKVGSEDSPYYFRPFGGINFALIINSGARGDGEAELGIQSMNTYQLSVSVGVEMRKYFGEENYLYLLPILQKGLLNDGGGTNVGFWGAENIAITPAYNVDTSMALYLGGQGNVGENLAVNGGVGVKFGFEKKDLLTNWNVGLRYKF